MARARYDLEDRLIRFGAGVCQLADQLPSTVIGRHVAHQVIRSRTSPIANYGEVQGAESRRDFIHKLGMCLKELRETGAWLKLIAKLDLCPNEVIDVAKRECDELIAVFATSIQTARRNDRSTSQM
jgi:four helix bundle protein